MLLRWWNNVRQIELLEDEVEFWQHQTRHENERAAAWTETARQYAQNSDYWRERTRQLQHEINCYWIGAR